jgi:L-asparaginase/Glu-tRNA(Gln) amidotransferase subunit D
MGSINLWKIIENKIYFIKNWYHKVSDLKILPEFNTNIGLIKLFPWIDSNILDYYKNSKAVVIEAFGPWNIPFEYSNWLGKIKELTKNWVSIFIATQNAFWEVDMTKYEVGQKAARAWAISCHDMTPETALVKLMWIFGNYPNYNQAQVKKLFLTNICWEISNNDDI